MKSLKPASTIPLLLLTTFLSCVVQCSVQKTLPSAGSIIMLPTTRTTTSMSTKQNDPRSTGTISIINQRHRSSPPPQKNDLKNSKKPCQLPVTKSWDLKRRSPQSSPYTSPSDGGHRPSFSAAKRIRFQHHPSQHLFRQFRHAHANSFPDPAKQSKAAAANLKAGDPSAPVILSNADPIADVDTTLQKNIPGLNRSRRSGGGTRMIRLSKSTCSVSNAGVLPPLVLDSFPSNGGHEDIKTFLNQMIMKQQQEKRPKQLLFGLEELVLEGGVGVPWQKTRLVTLLGGSNVNDLEYSLNDGVDLASSRHPLRFGR